MMKRTKGWWESLGIPSSLCKGYNYEVRVLHVIYLYGPWAEGKYTYFRGGEGASLSRNEGGKRLFVVLAAVSTSLTLPV